MFSWFLNSPENIQNHSTNNFSIDCKEPGASGGVPERRCYITSSADAAFLEKSMHTSFQACSPSALKKPKLTWLKHAAAVLIP